jgi:hypothetical protein
MEHEYLLLHSQSPRPLPVPSLNNPIHAAPPSASWRPILILFSRVRLGLSSGLFFSGFLAKLCMRVFCLPYVLHALTI